MTDYKTILELPEYQFLRTEERLGRNIILLGLGGSRSYGTNIETSDIDVRGITLNSKSDLLGMTEYEQYVDQETDTVIYALNKIIQLFMECNPNTIELLGLKPEHYLYVSEIGQIILDNRKLFLSRRAAFSFGGYASSQLRRLQNAIARDSMAQTEREQHIMNSVQKALNEIERCYKNFESGSVELFIDKAVNPEFESEIFVNMNLRHYPLRDYSSMWDALTNVLRDYNKIGKRNSKKDDMHLNKHAMHLIRLFMMAIDILERGEIKTYREEEHNLLMDIRMGRFQKDDGTYTPEFYEILSDYEKRLDYAEKNTILPDEPDKEKIQEIMMAINERVVRGEF